MAEYFFFNFHRYSERVVLCEKFFVVTKAVGGTARAYIGVVVDVVVVVVAVVVVSLLQLSRFYRYCYCCHN